MIREPSKETGEGVMRNRKDLAVDLSRFVQCAPSTNFENEISTRTGATLLSAAMTHYV